MISEKQKKILAFSYTEKYTALICDGAVRSGKTSFMMISFIDWAMQNFNNQRFGICGKTVDSAIKNIIVPYISLFYAKNKYIIKWKKSEKILEIKFNEKINIFEIFGGKDESSFSLIQGRTLAGVLLDEVVLMPRSFVEQALTRCSIKGAKFWFSCNPGSPQHWFFEEWILDKENKKALYLHFKMTDNPSLDTETLERYNNIFKGVFHQRYVQGKWVLAEGLVYNFDFEKHGFDVKNVDFINNDNIIISGDLYITIDYGIVNPFAAYLWVIYNNVAYCCEEYYFNSKKEQIQLTDEEHYQNIENKWGKYNIQTIIIDPSATSFKQTIRRYGKYNIKNAKNDVINGISTFTTLLNANLIKISSNCKEFIKEMSLYCWDINTTEDSVIKENDHACDANRYFAYTILTREFRWFDWR